MAGKVTVVPGEWLTTEETMRELGKSRRTVQKLAQRKQLRWKLQPRHGRARPERLYRAEDVERVAREAPVPAPSAAVATVKRPTPAGLGPVLKRLNAAASLAIEPARVRITEKLWLSLGEAQELSGLARTDLVRECRRAAEGRRNGQALIVRKSGGWKILRKSLEQFEG